MYDCVRAQAKYTTEYLPSIIYLVSDCDIGMLVRDNKPDRRLPVKKWLSGSYDSIF